MENQRFEISGTLTPKELLRAAYFQMLSRSWPIFLLLGLFLLACLAYAAVQLLDGSESEYSSFKGNLISVIPWALVGILYFAYLPYQIVKAQQKTQPHIFEPIVYIFNAESMFSFGKAFDWRMNWNLIKQIGETESLFVIHTSPNNIAVLPKRFFKDPTQANDWYDFVLKQSGMKRPQKLGVVARLC